ncbi:MAG TPA: gamma-glutamyltransferase, partial [Candidatus Saccharimonadales bacterium]|nr:gamma-glutamyltransferase [Candidatus Saccharimonadales bacterium]
MKKWAAIFLGCAVALALGVAQAAAGPRAAALERGVVVAPESLASEVGAQVLRQGGNAVDAAIAVQFALAVTFPSAGNLGGGGFMLVHTDSGEVAVDYRETAPAAASRDMYLDPTGDVIPGLSLDTHRAAGVPGTVAGMWLAHQKFGTIPWPRLLEPAIRLAEQGWRLSPWAAARFAAEHRNNFREYFRGAPGERFVQRELAATLRRIAAEGRDDFYLGETARLIVEEMRRGGGLITREDLAAYGARLREPLQGSYRGCRVVSMPPPSSGGVALLQLLNMLEPLHPAELGHNSAGYVHLVAEMEKRVFADRAEYLGDPDVVNAPVAALVSKAYAAARAADISLQRRTPPAEVRCGRIETESEETTHFSVVDRWGNAVANTTTLNDGFGSGVVVRGAGFLLNNEMDDFSAKPGTPNLYGVTGGEANAIGPGKRMLSSMSPTFVFRDGALWLVLGTPGGPTIFTTVFQVIVNRVDFGMPLAEAVAAPRFHHQWPPPSKDADPVDFERAPGVPDSVRAALEQRGYAVRLREPLGDVHAIEIQGRQALGVSDPRGV